MKAALTVKKRQHSPCHHCWVSSIFGIIDGILCQTLQDRLDLDLEMENTIDFVDWKQMRVSISTHAMKL